MDQLRPPVVVPRTGKLHVRYNLVVISCQIPDCRGWPAADSSLTLLTTLKCNNDLMNMVVGQALLSKARIDETAEPVLQTDRPTCVNACLPASKSSVPNFHRSMWICPSHGDFGGTHCDTPQDPFFPLPPPISPHPCTPPGHRFFACDRILVASFMRTLVHAGHSLAPY